MCFQKRQAAAEILNERLRLAGATLEGDELSTAEIDDEDEEDHESVADEDDVKLDQKQYQTTTTITTVTTMEDFNTAKIEFKKPAVNPNAASSAAQKVPMVL
jgi:hypothetical protein